MHDERSQPALPSNMRALVREALLLRGYADTEIDVILRLLDDPEAQAELEDALLESFSRVIAKLREKLPQGDESADV